MPLLRVLKGPNAGQVFEVQPGPLVLGRAPACDIVLTHAAVSRQHAQIECVDGRFVIEDLESSNGMRVNGESKVRHELRDNDLIKICGYHLAFEDLESRAAQEEMLARETRDGHDPLTETAWRWPDDDEDEDSNRIE